MSDDDTPRDTRDLRMIFRATTIVAVVVSTLIGSVIYAAVSWTRLVTRVEALEERQKQRDREASRELWRRNLNPTPAPHQTLPGVEPKS